MRTGAREAVSVLVLGASFLSVPLGYWAGPPPDEPAPGEVHWLKPEQLPFTIAEIRGLYERFLDRLASPSCLKHSYRFIDEAHRGRREARLLALSFPDEVEALASPMARSLSASPQKRWAALRFLGFLANAGHPGAKRTLEDLVEDRSPRIADAALYMLGESDLEGEYVALYLKLALRGNARGAIFLSYHPDSIADALSRAAGLLPSARFPAPAYVSEEYRRRLAYLGDSSYFAAVNAAFAEEEPADYDRIPWLIEFGERHCPAELRAALRARLDRDFAAFEKRGGSHWGYATGSQNPSETFHDDMLVALLRAGGKLHPHEAHRLEKYGYGCDPRKRLYEILREGPFAIY